MDIKIVKHSFFKHSLFVGILLFVSNLGFPQEANLYIYGNHTFFSSESTEYVFYELRYKKANEIDAVWEYDIILNFPLIDEWGEEYTPYTLTYLEPNQQYVVQVRGYSQDGFYSAWGYEVVFTTPLPEEWNGTLLPWVIDGVEVRCGAPPLVPNSSTVVQVPDSGPVIEGNKSEAIKKEEDE